MGSNLKMRLNLVELVPKLLSQRPNQRLSAREVAELVKEAAPNEWADKEERAGRTPAEARNQVVAEIGARRHEMQRRHPEFAWFDEPGTKRQFAWVSTSEEERQAQAEAAVDTAEREGLATPQGTEEARLREVDLYPKLASWLLAELDVRSMRIDENRTAQGAPKGANFNRWRFPDVVGVEDLRDGWHREIRQFADKHGAPRCRLWSFEVKLLVNRANLRDYYLQAVYNSSWANRGYLVAAKIESDDNTRDELAILADTHGIGVIELSLDDVSNTQVLIQARDRNSIDWRACERLFSANQDFQSFLKQVLRLYQTDELPEAGWLVEMMRQPRLMMTAGRMICEVAWDGDGILDFIATGNPGPSGLRLC
jgi:hypothetical protein